MIGPPIELPELVSGEIPPRISACVSEEPFDVAGALEMVSNDGFGARAVFLGVVRNHDQDRAVLSLEYTAHPDVERFLESVAVEVVSTESAPCQVVARHRVGHLSVGDVALLVIVGTTHRAQAMHVCGALVEAIKHQVPIWKQQHFLDGTSTWSNCPQ